jgi:hypothetical protein
MTPEEITLWNNIKSFNLDEDQSSFTFSARLARENGWTADYTARVSEEYKKFIFLCCISPKGVTPSDAVDQAWHLHLTYTKSYWVDLCQNTLHKEIHHNPTKGGNSEAQKFDDYYTDSFKLYKDSFGTEPPADIWPDNETRFSDINFQRVNLETHGLVKRWVLTALWIVAGLILVTFLLVLNEYNQQLAVLIVIIILIIFVIYRARNLEINITQTGGGCSGGDGGCSTDTSHGHHGGHGDHSDGGGHGGHGCSSGCSGCSSSGCSGCGGGD